MVPQGIKTRVTIRCSNALLGADPEEPKAGAQTVLVPPCARQPYEPQPQGVSGPGVYSRTTISNPGPLTDEWINGRVHTLKSYSALKRKEGHSDTPYVYEHQEHYAK